MTCRRSVSIPWLLGGFYSSFRSDTGFYSVYPGTVDLFGTDVLPIIDQPISIKHGYHRERDRNSGGGPPVSTRRVRAPRIPAAILFNPDTLWSYELGEKYMSPERRLSLNSSFYCEKWRDIQQQVTLSCGFLFTAPAVRESTGARSKSSSLRYLQPLANDYALTMSLTNEYVGPMQDITFTRNAVPGYDLLGARLGVQASSWSAYAFLDNATNRMAELTNINALSANVPQFNRVAIARPRTIGIDLQYRY